MNLGDVTLGSIQIELARRSYKRFVQAARPGYVFKWYHEVLAAKLEAFARGEITHLIVTMPPQHGKSELVSRLFPPWLFGINPELKIGGCSYGDALAARMNRDVQRIMDSQVYTEIFPDSRLEGSNVRSVANGKYLRNSDLFEIVDHTGSYRSAGIGSGLTGMPLDILIVDDPIKDQKEADSITYRNMVWEWYGSVAETRLNKNGQVLILQTRWHEDDLAGRLLKLAKDDPQAQQWEVVSFPAIKVDDTNPEDPREIGDALWPEKFPVRLLEKRKRVLGTRRFASLYQQEPSPVEGAVIKRAWCTNYYRQLPAKLDEWIISADLTFKDLDSSDYVVFETWARAGAEYYLVDEIRDRMDFPTTCAALEAFVERWPLAFVKLIEDKANGPALIATLKKKIPGLIAFNPQGSKNERLAAVSPSFEAGNVRLPHPEIAHWIHDWVEEICTNGKHDDRKDACSMALLRFMGPSSSDFPDELVPDNVETISGRLDGGPQW